MKKRYRLGVAVVGFLLGATELARADDVQQAKAHFSIAARAYEANQFRVAIDAFEEAYRLAPRPAILFSIAQAYRRQYFAEQQRQDLSQAIAYYRRYIKDDPKGKRVTEAVSAVADLEAVAARIGLDPNAREAPVKAPESRGARLLVAPSVKGATARVDQGSPVELPNRIDVKPGKHTVVVEASGYQAERREIDIGPGESFALDVRLLEKPATVKPLVDEGVRLFVDGRFAATTPLVKALELPAGPHTISMSRRGHDPVSMQHDLNAGEFKSISADFSASSQRVTSYVLFGIAAAATVTGGVFTGLAFAEQKTATNLEDLASQGNLTTSQREQHEEAIRRRNLNRGIAFG
ncbi:MAG TPA: PEGA domain-containing protein, partial [Polyangiaceae bacterium]